MTSGRSILCQLSPVELDGIGLTRELFPRLAVLEIKVGRVALGRVALRADFVTELSWHYFIACASRDLAARAGTGGPMP